MAQSTLSVRMDAELKQNFDAICDELGMSMSTAVTILAKKMVREQRMPFEVAADPFYSELNMRVLDESVQQLKEGKVHTFTWEEFEQMAGEAENG